MTREGEFHSRYSLNTKNEYAKITSPSLNFKTAWGIYFIYKMGFFNINRHYVIKIHNIRILIQYIKRHYVIKIL